MFKLDSIFTNGYVDIQTMEAMQENGYTFVVTVPATLAHPHAMPNDKLSIFAKYTRPEISDDCCGCIPETNA